MKSILSYITLVLTLTFINCQNSPPGQPIMTGLQNVVLNEVATLTCTSVLGVPKQNVTWLRNSLVVTGSVERSEGLFLVSELSFLVKREDHFAVYDCEVDNNILQSPLVSSRELQVSFGPQPPTLDGPTTVLAGQPTVWTCTSYDAYPLQTMTMKIGEQVFDNQFSSSLKFNATRLAYDVVGTLTWPPSMTYDGQDITCEVQHVTLQTPQTASVKMDVKVAPSPPVITVPQNIDLNGVTTLTCSTNGGDPVPAITWFVNDSPITGATQTTTNGVTISTYTFTAAKEDNLKTYKCVVSSDLLQEPLITTYDINVIYPPDPPILQGPTSLLSGSPYSWTCTSIAGSPVPTLSMRLGNTKFVNDELQVSSFYNNTINGYVVTGVLTWSPTVSNNGSMLFCDASHVTSSSPQTVGQTIYVKASSSPIVQQLFTPNLSWGEIVSILLVLLFLLSLLLICACINGCCCWGLCCGAGYEKRKQVCEHNHMHIYQLAVVGTREEKERHDYEIRKYEVVDPDSTSVASDNKSFTTTTTSVSRLSSSDVSYTYDEEVRRRQKWKKAKQKKKRSSRQRTSLSNDIQNQIVLEERIMNDNVQYKL